MTQDALQFVEAHPLILATLKILIVFLVLSGLVAYLVYMERKVLAFMQARLGPMRVGPWGLLQPVADGIKLLLKEDIIPAGADKFVFLLAPVISVIAAFTVFAVIPFAGNFFITDINIGIMFILAVSSLGIYGIILGGWASNSHYPLLGSLRSAAQLVSYEVAGGMAIVGVLLVSNSLSMVEIVKRQSEMGVWNIFLQPLAFFIFLVAGVAETNRNPFDLPEAESELTAGFHTEYSGFRFSLYFLAEYTAMVVISCLAVTLFLGGWLRPFESVRALDFLNYAPALGLLGAGAFIAFFGLQSRVPMERSVLGALAAICVLLALGLAAWPAVLNAVQGIFWFTAKMIVFLYAFIWYRGTFPRYRYDQLMRVGWRWMIPLALANIIVTAAVRYWLSASSSSPTAGLGG
ncbi:MAG: NADH-quinone oxidoreductase subunit NuoH [Acidobacteria bacterium]|nr:NADH-quinone oxidoreductase subunit NuoH [Acidobacteriota bacterium]